MPLLLKCALSIIKVWKSEEKNADCIIKAKTLKEDMVGNKSKELRLPLARNQSGRDIKTGSLNQAEARGI